jgi:hypothetical protein
MSTTSIGWVKEDVTLFTSSPKREQKQWSSTTAAKRSGHHDDGLTVGNFRVPCGELLSVSSDRSRSPGKNRWAGSLLHGRRENESSDHLDLKTSTRVTAKNLVQTTYREWYVRWFQPKIGYDSGLWSIVHGFNKLCDLFIWFAKSVT